MKTLLKIPDDLIQEIKALISPPDPTESTYLIYTRSLTEKPKLNYTRLSKGGIFLSYSISEVVKYRKLGYIPLAILQTKYDPKPSPIDVLTWILTDLQLKTPLTYIIAYIILSEIRVKPYSLRNCLFCENNPFRVVLEDEQ